MKERRSNPYAIETHFGEGFHNDIPRTGIGAVDVSGKP
jgi:hypothetical protein